MKIEYFVKKDYMTIEPLSGINVIKNELLNQKAVVVCDDTEYVGTLTATDILERPHNLVIDCMSKKPQVTTDYTVCKTLKIMKNKSTDVLPVCKNEKFYGLIYKNDLVEYLTEYTNELHGIVDVKTQELQELTENLENIIEEKTHELRKLNVTKDKFFSIIAHDLRNPFNLILGFSKILEERANTHTPEKVEKLAKIIKDVSLQTYELLENLLEWSKTQQNKIAFSPETINLKELVETKISHLEILANNKEIKLFHTISHSTFVNADINMLKTILRNLISNSIKFTEHGGSVFIASSDNRDYTEISVTDTGVGMTEAQIENLFKIQHQISTTGTNKEKGSGLGLILCKEFIEKHDGKISINSKKEEGTSFVFSIPRNKKGKSDIYENRLNNKAY